MNGSETLMIGIADVESLNSRRTPLDPLFWGTPLPYKKKFIPLGVIVEIASNSEKALEAAEESFGPFGAVDDSAPAAYSLQICRDEINHQTRPFPQASFRALGNLFHVSCGNASFAVADLHSNTAFGFIADEVLSDRSFFRNVFLECLFYVIAVNHQFTPVHAAAIEKNHRGVLIWGEPGAGKSTLAYACAKAGFQLIADDVVYLQIDPSIGKLMAWGRPWQLRLLPDAKNLFPELAEEETRLRSDHQWYLEIDLRKRYPTAPQLSFQPTLLLFLAREPSGSARLEAMEGPEISSYLERDIFLTKNDVLSRHYSMLRQLAQLDSRRLIYSGPPSQAVELIEELVR